MQFDLKTFLERGRTPYETEFSLALSGWDFPGYRVDAPVGVRFRAVPTAEGVDLTCAITAEAAGECARCLAPVVQPYAFTRSWSVRPADLASEELELPLEENGVLPLSELVYQELVLEIEPVLLCREDCEGLCPVCGRPKADGCGCCAPDVAPGTALDPRLAGLRKLLE